MDVNESVILSLQPVIESCVHAFCRRYPDMDEEELVLEAQKYAILAVQAFNGLGDINGWVGYKIKTQLSSRVRRKKWREQFTRPSCSNHIDRPEPERFSLVKFLESLSDDAQRVVITALHCGTRQLTIQRLTKLGWFREGVEQVFAEIRRELMNP